MAISPSASRRAAVALERALSMPLVRMLVRMWLLTRYVRVDPFDQSCPRLCFHAQVRRGRQDHQHHHCLPGRRVHQRPRARQNPLHQDCPLTQHIPQATKGVSSQGALRQ